MRTSKLCRITPAYAGNTRIKNILGGRKKDHPRLRGEHNFSIAALTFLLGSPPPTRGTQYHGFHVKPGMGITPAYAGNTKQIGEVKDDERDHPRLRGEH